MKIWIYCVAMVVIGGSTGYLWAQTTPKHLTGVTYGPLSSPTKITADDITYSETQRTTYARGSVRIVSASSTITADEADLHLLNLSKAQQMSVDLRGNVRVLIAPDPTR